jgi:hypothetical protein
MTEKPDYTQTYWSHKGKHEALNAELNKLVPYSGTVDNADDNPALETFRIASNCYYDLYNNGLCNRAKEFRKVFGFSGKNLQVDGDLTQELIDHTETAMDKIIILAAHEQHLGESKAETIDITPEGCKTPDGAKRVQDAMNKIESANARVADIATQMVDRLAANLQWDSKENDMLKEAIQYRKDAYAELLRAVAGR